MKQKPEDFANKIRLLREKLNEIGEPDTVELFCDFFESGVDVMDSLLSTIETQRHLLEQYRDLDATLCK